MDSIPAKCGEIFVLVENVKLLIPNTGSIDLESGEIVVAISTSEYEGEIWYVTSHGLGTLPNDDTFYMHEAERLA